MRNGILVLSLVSIIGCGVEGRSPNPTPPPLPSASELADEKADRSCKYHCADYGYAAGECYMGWQCDGAGSCLKYVGTPDAPTACPAPPPPPPPPSTAWREGLPAGDFDLCDDLPIVISTTGQGDHLPLRVTGNRDGTVHVIYTSGEIGSRGDGDQQSVVVPSDGSFKHHLDFTYSGEHIIEDVAGSLLPGGKLSVGSYRYQNLANDADWHGSSTVDGTWAPTPPDWYYR